MLPQLQSTAAATQRLDKMHQQVVRLQRQIASVHVWKLYAQYRQEEGQDLIEYALLVGLLALAAVAGLMSAGSAIQDLF
ncbi:MAG: hypothetical protein ACK4SA_12670 [Caldilinea sp.]